MDGLGVGITGLLWTPDLRSGDDGGLAGNDGGIKGVGFTNRGDPSVWEGGMHGLRGTWFPSDWVLPVFEELWTGPFRTIRV